MTGKDILEFVQSSKNIIDTDSDLENEMNNASPVPKSTEMRNIIKKAGRRAVLLAKGIVRSVPLEIIGSSGHEKVPTCGKPGLERPGIHEERGSKDRAASTCGSHSDSFDDTSRRRRSNCSTNNFQTPLYPSALSVHSL
ncbi:hypothetical protein TNCV_2266271 [Trichonephila clavipes]|nr:hypothetical protein TNCV_2266271 [Trichonephila clavipes]